MADATTTAAQNGSAPDAATVLDTLPSVDYASADELQKLIEATDEWPPPAEWARQREVELFAALREADEGALRALTGWDHARPYVVDPLPGRIAEAYASALFGADPKVKPADDADADLLAALVEENDLPSELHRAEEICSSEGEVWWRLHVDSSAFRHPVIEWHSRAAVLPLWRGKALLAVAFISELRREDAEEIVENQARPYTRVWRHVEIQAEGLVRNLLYRGEPQDIGETISLSDEAQVADLPDEWEHGLPMLCGRIANKLGRDPQAGISDYSGVRSLLLALNEAQSIASENARLTAKKRLFVSGELTDAKGDIDAGADVIQVASEDGAVSQATGNPPIKEVEYAYDAQALIAHLDHLTQTIVTRVGLVAEFVGTDTPGGGEATSGTMLRLRMIPTTLTSKGKARPWDDQLPKIITLCQLVDAMDAHRGGFGRNWAEPAAPPAVERQEPIPEDTVEETARLSYLSSALLVSRRTALRELHPDWSDDQINEEITQIDKENAPVVEPQGGGKGAPSTQIAKPRPPISLHLPSVS